jgi:hypothetical protein
VEDCSTSWSSDDDDDTTSSSLDKIDVDGPRSSYAIDISTPSTLDDDDSCSGYESDVSTSSSTSPHFFMSHGDTKISIGNVVVDCDDPNFELVCRLTNALRNDTAKTSKLKNENSFLRTTCEQQKHLLYVTTCSHEELKLAHEELSVTHDNLEKTMLYSIRSFLMKILKLVKAHHLGQMINHIILLTLVM